MSPNGSITTTDLTVIDRVTGELLDLTSASPLQIAEFIDHMDVIRSELSEHDTLARHELVRRLDMNGKWTLRVGEPTDDMQYEIKAPSPTAGTDGYPPADLEAALLLLLDDDVISETGADSALDRHLVVTARVAFSDDLDQLANTVRDAVGVVIAGATVDVIDAAAIRKPRKAGITALRKVPGVAGVLDEVVVVTPVGSRRASVKRIDRARA